MLALAVVSVVIGSASLGIALFLFTKVLRDK